MIIKNHTGQYGTKRDHMGPYIGQYRNIWEHTEPYGKIPDNNRTNLTIRDYTGPLDHTGPYQTLRDHKGPFGRDERPYLTIHTISDHTRPCKTMRDHTGPYWTIQDHLGPYRTILDHIGLYRTIQDHKGP